jgi:hypothetical protein
VEDVNGDLLPDLVCLVNTAEFTLSPGVSVAVLVGNLYNGNPIRGEDVIRIVP